MKTTGDFVIEVTKEGTASEDPSESEKNGGGGGCNVGVGLAVLLAAALAGRRIRRN